MDHPRPPDSAGAPAFPAPDDPGVPHAAPGAKWPLWKAAIGVFGVWTLVGLWSANQQVLLGLARGRPIETPGVSLVLSLYDVWLWAAFTPLFVWAARKYPLGRGRVIGPVVVYGLVGAGTHLLDVALDEITFPLLTGRAAPGFLVWLLAQADINLVSTGAVIAITLALDYYRASRTRQVHAARLESRLAQTQLQELRAQLHPHFLFNTLNAISALMHRDVNVADQVLGRLADLLRMSIASNGAQEVTLGAELEFASKYLDIEQVRLGDRLRVSLDVAPGLRQAAVPSLLLQPLVENAVKHGIAPRGSGGLVEVAARRDNSSLTLTIRDDGLGLGSRGVREGLGLHATRERLVRLYGGAHRFEIRQRPTGGVEVTVSLPFRLFRSPQSPGG